MSKDKKYLSFGLEAHAPWPLKLPDAQWVISEQRHLTLAFLGHTSCKRLLALLPELPLPALCLAPIALFDQCLCAPQQKPRLVAWHFILLEAEEQLTEYQKQLIKFLNQKGYTLPHYDFLKKVTLSYRPYSTNKWKQSFQALPLYFRNLHLYAHNEQLHYIPIWTHSFHPPFVEIEHEADVAFYIYGESVYQINLNAQIALAFHCPDLTAFLNLKDNRKSIEEIIMGLNEIVTLGDSAVGTPFKAVSFHGEIEKQAQGMLRWKMIIDV